MKLNRKFNTGAMCVMLTLASAQVSALTLGRMRGAALLGKELDVSVIVQFAADEDVTSTCFTADVLYGETPLERSRIAVKSEPGPQPNTKLVRVTSSARVDEAVVTVNLLAACGPKASRHYVMLADVITEPAAGTPMNAPVSSAAAVSAVVRKDVAVAQAAASTVAPVAQARIKAKRPVAAASPAAPVVAPAVKAAAAADKSERDAVAKAANQANAVALDELQQRVDAISKWQASSNAAEELLKSQAREKELEASIKGLHVVTAKNQQNLQIVAKALEDSESHNYGNFLVYALGALLAACLGAVAFVYTRLRNGDPDASPWWSGGVARTATPAPVAVAAAASAVMPLPPEPVAQPPAQVEVDLPLPVSTEKVQPVVAVAEPAQPLEPLDFDFMLSHQGKLDVGTDLATVAASAHAPMPVPMPVLDASALRPDSAPNAHVTLKAINTQEMLDVRQQAEFFMALGQHDEAVKLLESSINGSDDANPLVYLDLLKIFHTLSRRTDFERYREEFNRQFTGRVPAYANFLLEGNGLEAYDDICQQIVVLWPTDYTVDFIEQCLVRTPEDDPEQGIDLEAFKDLLLLYGVLKRLDQTLDSGLIPFKASRTASQSGHSISAGGALLPPLVPVAVPPVPVEPVAGFAHSAPADLDLDLDMGLDLNLDIVEDADKKVEQDNLINFDMSGYEPPGELKDPKK